MMMMVFLLSFDDRARERTNFVSMMWDPDDDGPDFFIPLFQKVLGFRVLFLGFYKEMVWSFFFFIKKYEREKKTLLLVA